MNLHITGFFPKFVQIDYRMSTITITKLYSLLSNKLGKESAENLTTYIEEKIKEEVEDKTKTLATREDLSELKGDLRTAIASTKAELIKRMFIFWIGQVAATFGFILLYLNK
ncbi:hypothetical protein [Parapedobacter koreensis]|uniref:Uncharacterized protein n=1 Tax=Parapedobacter koreensis TaxID=332977 RepID=A0A1H7M8A7_9SPHI|nr:hypothetical protein [Parapedobacter koreensis]SEL07560.1 hypothetical protein SAMN05421740_103411 [Parapedobacter koreensis]